MYAVIGEATIDADRIDESLRDLDETLIPLVTRAPGFVTGSWLRSADGSVAMSVLVFDTEAHANAMLELRPPDAPPDPTDPPVRGVGLRVFEVVRHV
jgi:hypothetical protein